MYRLRRWSEQLHRSIERGTAKADRGPGTRAIVGIDEVSYHVSAGKYAKLVYDLERSVVVWVGQGRWRRSRRHHRPVLPTINLSG